MKTSLTFGLVSAASALAGSPASFAQAAGDLSIEVGECVDLESADERLACFERQVDTALTARDGRTQDGDVPGAQGARAETHASSRSTADDNQREQPEQIVSAIAALDETLPNTFVITLENGQTWRQVRSERHLLRVGDRVTVYPTRWGNSYRLTAEEAKGFIQVERVR